MTNIPNIAVLFSNSTAPSTLPAQRPCCVDYYDLVLVTYFQLSLLLFSLAVENYLLQLWLTERKFIIDASREDILINHRSMQILNIEFLFSNKQKEYQLYIKQAINLDFKWIS